MKKLQEKILSNKRIFCLTVILSLLLGVQIYAASNEYILPESNTRYLDGDDVKGMTLQEINYAKNELYARHGYLFKSQELRDYFSSFSWYNGTTTGDKFNEALCFNSYEKANRDFLSELEHSMASNGYQLDCAGYDINIVKNKLGSGNITGPVPEETVKSMKAGKVEKLGKDFQLDLDGDGKMEDVKFLLEFDDDYYDGTYALQINDKVSEQVHGLTLHDDLYGVGLGNEKIYLIAAQDGPSDDPEAEFYTWEDQKIVQIGTIAVFINDITTDGKGIIMGSQRTNVMDTNFMNGKWEIGTDGKLHLGGDGIYKLNRTDYELKKAITVYEDCNYTGRSREIEPQEIEVLYTNGKTWVYIKAADGKWGWFESGVLSYEEKDKTFGRMFYAG